MKTFKKILCTLLVVVICLTSAPLQGFVGLEWPSLPEIDFGNFELPDIDFGSWFSSKVSAASEGYYTYTITDGEATITDVDSSISGDVVIPSTLGGYSVTTIGYKAFLDCDSLTSVEIPDSVITVGDYAFYNCNSLTSVTIGDSVTTIGDSAFFYCDSLTSVTIGDSVTTIGDHAFTLCDSLTSVTIPDSVTTIGEWAFSDCTSLTSVTIPDSVTTIGDYAFAYCHSLTSVTIPDSVTTIGERAFVSCGSLTSIVVDINNSAYSNDSRGVLFNKNKTMLIQYPAGNTGTSYTIPDSVTTIGYRAFYDCTSLTSVTIGDSVTTIGDRAFYYCDSLTDVYYNGTEEQWKKITIGSYNNCLIYATIHYNGSGLEVTTGYKREHVVDNWKALNQSYKSEYLAGFAVPMDGTNGNPDYLIPGQSENMIPQGLTYWPEKDWVLVSSYDKNKENPSAIFALDREKGAFVAQFNMYTKDGKAWKTHAGGIGVSNNNLYITSGNGVGYFPLSDLDVPSGTVKDITRADYVNFGQLGKTNTAYVNVSDGILWAGNFYTNYPGWSAAEGIAELLGWLPDSWDDPAALDYNSLVLGFKLSGDNSEDEWNNLKSICDSATYRIGIDNDMQCIQGIAFKKVEGKKYRMYLSRTTNVSFGAEITVTDITLNEKNLKVSKEHCEGFKNLTGTEGITFIGDDLHIVYESGALSYAGGLGWGTYKDLTDVIWKVNENDLLGLIGIRYEGLLNHKGIKYDYDYSDSYFAGSSFNYNHDLAIASYCLAISSMVNEGTGKDGKYGTEELDAARKFFNVTEFDNCQPYGYDKKPEFDSIACVIGHKNVVLNGQEETVIAIGIRGAGYGSEWSGNFRLGNSTDHAGFVKARKLVMEYLEQYIEDFGYSFNSNLKFWITGYSRAAATANLVAATLNNDGALNGVKFDFVNDIKERYSSGDVYAYTFETPLNTTSKEASAAKYSNIYNFINRIDYVPKVAPSAWGYTRYGENLYMPSLETEGTRYYEYLDEMKKEYEKMTGDRYDEKFDFYEVGLFMEGHDLIPDDISLTKVNGYISQSEFLDELIDIVANDVIISADNYVKNYESSVRKLMPVIMDGSLDLKITLKDVIEELSFLELITGRAENMIARVLMKKVAEAMTVSGLSYDEVYDCLGILDELVSVSANNLDYVWTLLENASNIKPAHEPSVNFAWLASIEPELYDALEDGDWYLKFVYNCPIDIALYDENDELLATIIDDKVVFPDDRYLTVYVDSDGQKCFCLPNDTEYRFEILGTDEGTMTCSVSKYDFTENQTTEILNYYDIPVEDGTELTMTVNEAIEEELTEKVEMTDSDEKILNYDDHLESEEIETFNVSVTTNTENGYVSGGGTYHKGEYAKVEAAEIGCNKFIGWYIDNTCISTEIEYRLPVTESVVIEARFSEKHTMGEWYEILPATCETSGTEQRDCSECDYSETQEIPATGHDFDGSKCKNCDYDKADTCGCNCHKGGIAGFFFKLILFFQKIFKSNKECNCGKLHY